jgi:threonine dehydratase
MYIRESVKNNYDLLSKVIKKTPLQYNDKLSKLYNANIYLKREDLQFTRSFKIRGVYMKLIKETIAKNKTIVCSSAGNHAQSVAYLCNKLNIKCDIFLPRTARQQKINKIKEFSNPRLCNIHYAGSIFDECLAASKIFANNCDSIYVHPFDDLNIISGHGTIGLEIENAMDMDIVIATIGGGGLISGISSYMKNNGLNKPKIIGVESENNDSMRQSIAQGKIIKLHNNDSFVDGSAVKEPGKETFELCKQYVDDFLTISNNRTCHDLINLYQDDGIVAELAGAMPISALHMIKNDIKGKNICCVISGGNNDVFKFGEIYDRKLIYDNDNSVYNY